MRERQRTKSKFVEKVGTAIDNTLAIVAPAIAYKRMAYRKAVNMLTSYRGASKDRLRENWLPGGLSPDADLLPELADLRERSRDLNRNDPTASGITTTMSTNVVGSGIKPQSRVDKDSLGITDEQAIIFQKKAERIWERWVPYADVGGRMDFYDIESLIDRQILENGEAILLPMMLKDTKRPYGLAFDIIEADRLDTPSDLRGDKSIRYGVKIGPLGEPVTYYIKKTHPGDVTISKEWKSNDFVPYPAKNDSDRKNIIHLYYVQRPGQTRGIPFFAPVLSYFKNLADYLEAEIVTARIAACFAVFVKKSDPEAAAFARTSDTDPDNKRIEELEPGIIEYLHPGESIETFNPNRPGNTFDPFVDRILRSICGALNLPYEIVIKDFSKTNYSSARAALLEARRYFKLRQEWTSRKLCQPAWEMLLEEAFLKGELDAPTFYDQKDDWVRAKWIAPGWPWVDPSKDVDASVKAIQAGLSTQAEECGSQGRDWEGVAEQRAREEAKRKELGLPEISVSKTPAPAQPAQDNMPPDNQPPDEEMNTEVANMLTFLGDEINGQVRTGLKEEGAVI